MDKTEIKIDEEILNRTIKCMHDFSCLSGNKECFCKVIGTIGFDMKDIKPKLEIDCNYRVSFGDGFLCVCPTRNEIYNRYRV